MTAPQPPAGRGPAALLLVLALHAALLWLLSQQLSRRPPTFDSARSVIRLLLPEPKPPRLDPATRPSPRPALPAPVQAPPDRVTEKANANAPAPPAPGTAPPLPAETSTAPARSGLRLTLPAPPASAPWRNPALSDPRANTARPTLEARIAAAAGGDLTLHEDKLDEGRRRFRSGSRCVILKRARNAELDPMNDNSRATPALVEACP